MENDIFAASLSTADHGHVVFNTASSHMFSAPFMHPGIIDHNTHEQIMDSTVPSMVQEEFLNNLYTTNNYSIPNDGTLVSRSILHNGSPFAEGYSGDNHIGTSLSAASLTNLFSSNVGPGEGVFSINNNSSASALPLDMRPLDSCNSFNSSYTMPRNHDYTTQDGAVHDEFLKAISTVHPSYHVMGNTLPAWNSNNSTLKLDHSDIYSLPRNELSLSLGSCQPSVICMPDIPDHCSEKSCSVVTQVTPNGSEELSLYFGPSTSVHFSNVLLGSRYLDAAQQVLAEVVGYALGNFEQLDDSVSGIEGGVRMSSSSCSRSKGLSDVGSDEFTSSGEIKSQEDVEYLMVEENKAEKNKLVTMLQMVDHRYNQCLDNIQNVITTFHDATNSSSPQVLARFALHTVSSAFKNLEKRITSQILLASQESSRRCTRGKEKDFESSFIQKQWALQLGRKDQQSWRPQRGLPERSVSVLRAWMFQNFLHPYPKDSDKHILALQSGLTRSQVSNWFINARVRLWKPMIEEMYSEIRKCQTEEVEGEFGSHGNINSHRPRTN